MPGFVLTGRAAAPVEEVWKLLFDPTRFPEWWAGVATVEVSDAADAAGAFTIWPDGYPDFPMPQRLRTDDRAGRVVVSCQVSDIDITWQLGDDGGDATTITVAVELPERKAHRLAGQRELIAASLKALARLAAPR
jgi:uncharacterized protein YndB with AHSA1/START domain